MGQKPIKKEKEYSALNVYIAPPEMNNFILATYYTDTYANQSLYTNLVNNFGKTRDERVCIINLKTLIKNV